MWRSQFGCCTTPALSALRLPPAGKYRTDTVAGIEKILIEYKGGRQ